MFKKHWLNISVLIIFLLVLFNSVYLYAANSKKINKPEVLSNTLVESKLSKEEKNLLIRDKINSVMKKKKLEREKQIKKEEKVKKLRQKIINDKLELESALEALTFPINLDISNKLKYKRLQERSLSCELSVVSDVASFFKNKKFTEDYIVGLVDKDYYNTPTKNIDNKTIWGNPNAGFVGYIDKLPSGEKATQKLMTGYGVLEKPINKVYKQLGFKTEVITGNTTNYNQKEHLTKLLKTLNKGNMVQLWGDYCTDPRYEDGEKRNICRNFNGDRKLEWYYKENGKLIKYEGLAGEHAFYLLGYKGGVENPKEIIVWDTITGKHSYKTKEWLRKWDRMQNRSIIIYK